MRGSELRLTQTYGEGWTLHVNVSGESLQEAKKLIDDLRGEDVSIEMKKWRKHRSLDANAYAWVLIDKIAQLTNIPKTDVYRQALKEVGGNTDTVCIQETAVERLCESWRCQGLGWQTDVFDSKINGCKNVVLYYGSSTFDSKQMSDFIKGLIEDAKALGIETLTPRDLQAMMERSYGK